MAIRSDGRPARTHYRVLERFRGHSCLKVKLDTGRTHQIRVHLAHLKHPLVGDPVYGRRLANPRGAGEPLIAALRGFRRQALHAAALAFDHPVSGARLSFQAPLPVDFADLLAALRADARGNAGTTRPVGA
jgi:23S rRNA pseudouridine1911/1915/1917 synthase